MVHEKFITNCPVTVQDVHNANQIFSPNLSNLRGKMTRTKPKHVRVDYVKIPRDFIQMHKYVMLVADVLFVNGLPFLVFSSRGISLIVIEFLPSGLQTSGTYSRMSHQSVGSGRIYCASCFDGHGVWKVERCLTKYHNQHHDRKRACRGDWEENMSNQGESKRDDGYTPLPYFAQDHDNWVDAFLRLVAELFPS